MKITQICRDNGRVVTLRSAADDYTCRPIITCSERMQERLALLESVAPTDQQVTIVGESGTCKQDYAEYIHRLSGRAQQNYLQFDCAGTQAANYEEQLFGAFREGSIRRGILETAAGGTVLLEGVSSIPESFCQQLERLLEEGTIVRRGQHEKTAVDVRLLATCSEDLMLVLHRRPRVGRLLQRLSAVRLDLLPLRQRKEDVALLALHYLEDANRRYGLNKSMGSALFREIQAYSWPGNERELHSFIEQVALVASGEVLDDPALIRSTERLTATLIPAWKRANAEAENRNASLKEQVREYELMIIRQSISKYGSLRKAAAALQVDPSVLSRKLAAKKE